MQKAHAFTDRKKMVNLFLLSHFEELKLQQQDSCFTLCCGGANDARCLPRRRRRRPGEKPSFFVPLSSSSNCVSSLTFVTMWWCRVVDVAPLNVRGEHGSETAKRRERGAAIQNVEMCMLHQSLGSKTFFETGGTTLSNERTSISSSFSSSSFSSTFSPPAKMCTSLFWTCSCHAAATSSPLPPFRFFNKVGVSRLPPPSPGRWCECPLPMSKAPPPRDRPHPKRHYESGVAVFKPASFFFGSIVNKSVPGIFRGRSRNVT